MKRTRIKAQSKKRRHQMAEYRALRKQFLKDNPVCQICETRQSYDAHHRRGRVGRALLDIQYWLAVCRRCHDEIHANPQAAYELGYKLRN